MKFKAFLLAASLSCAALAVPVRQQTRTVVQPDGTVLTLKSVGDEHLHYWVNVANDQPMQQLADGTFKPIEAKSFDAMKVRAKNRRQQANQRRLNRLKPAGPRKVGEVNKDYLVGERRGLVLLVEFSDVRFQYTHDDFERLFNQVGYKEHGAIGSVHDYFYDQSYQKFDLTFDVVGPITLNKTQAYYGGNAVAVDEEHGLVISGGGDMYPGQMVSEALLQAYGATGVDNEGTPDGGGKLDMSKYDWDEDGYVDQVFVIYAGYGENAGGSPDCIWAHESTLYNEWRVQDGWGPINFAGTVVDTYACSSELRGMVGDEICGIGTSCHEFSHCLGFPDFYDTDYSGGIGMSYFDLLHGGSYNGPEGMGEVPAGFSAYERWEAGWLSPTVIDEGRSVKDMKCLGDTAEAYVIYNSSTNDEFFMLENRQKSRWFQYFNKYEPPVGLLITHVDYDVYAWFTNSVNDEKDHQRYTFVPARGACGTYDEEYHALTISRDDILGFTFPGKENVTAMTEYSHMDCNGNYFNKTLNNDTYFDHRITQIQNKNGLVSFNVAGGVHVESPTAKEATGVTESAFTAEWTKVDDVASYDLELTMETLQTQQERPDDPHYIHESFKDAKSSGNKTIATDINDYTSTMGWTATGSIFAGDGCLVLGEFSYSNYQYKPASITTPTVTCFSDSLTVIVTAYGYRDKYVESGTVTVSIHNEDGRIAPAQTYSFADGETSHVFTFKGIPGENQVTITGGNAMASRVCLTGIDLYDGYEDEAKAPRKVKTTSVINDIVGTSYSFKGLSNAYQYTYRVRGVNAQGGLSPWSNPITVVLDASNTTGVGSIRKNPNGKVFNLQGVRVNDGWKGVVVKDGRKVIVK